MTSEPKIEYDYMALLQGVVWLVLLAGLVIVAITFKWLPRGSKWLSAWLREKRGDVLSVAVLLVSTCWELIVPMGLAALFSLACAMAIK